jgi:hypothetical protein
MAIDTASKRFSMMNLGTVPTSPLFIPDGTINDGDKYHLLNLYFGIALGSPVEVIASKYRGFISNVNRLGLR